MDTAQWPQGIVVKPIEEIVTNTCPKPSSNSAAANNLERKLARPHKEAALNCPRCNSTNTKFCYYNNYSLTQPRYFCKTCRRYWTDGGSLRNIPVGGGSRKNKRSSSSSSNSTTTSSNLSNNNSKRLPDLIQPQQGNSQGQDLNLGFPSSQVFPHHHQIPNIDQNSDKNHNSSSPSTTTTTTTSHLSALELLTGLTSRGLNSFIPMPLVPNSSDPSNPYTSGFPMSELMIKPTLNFSLEGLGSGYGSALQGHHHVQENSGRLLFPFEDLKQVSGSDGMDHHQQNDKEHHHGGDSTGYWTGMLGGGSW